jgi:hypothetical protein
LREGGFGDFTQQVRAMTSENSASERLILTRKVFLQARIERKIQGAIHPFQGEFRMRRIKQAVCFLGDNYAWNQESGGGARSEPLATGVPASR